MKSFLSRCLDTFWRLLNRNAYLVCAVLALLTAVLIGTGVYIAESADAAGWDLASDVVYETAQAIFLGMQPRKGPDSNWFIMVGQICAVLLVLFLGIQAVTRLLGESWQNLRLLFFRNHHVVCGLGRIGRALVPRLIERGQRVIVVERDADNDFCNDARRLGALVLHGDAADEEVLDHAKVGAAKSVYLVTGSDEDNIEAAINVQAVALTASAARSGPACFVHIVDPALGDVMAHSLRQVQPSRTLDIRTFNVIRNSVRHLLVEQLTPLRPRRADETALYIIVGFGVLAQTLAVYLAELAHFENNKRARLLILSDDPKAAADAFLSRWGQFSPAIVANDWAEVRFDPEADSWSSRKHRPRSSAYHVNDERAIEYVCNAIFAKVPAYIGDRGFVDMTARLVSEPGVRPAVLFCCDRDRENYVAAHHFSQILADQHDLHGVPMFAWLPRHEQLKGLLDERGPVRSFGNTSDNVRLEQLIAPLEDRIGMEVMAAYLGIDSDTERERVERAWREDSEVFRHSNRMAAVHFLIKLACSDLELVAADDARPAITDLTVPPEQLELLAKMEHTRWVAERLLAGWSYGAASKTPPRRPQLCPWDILNSDDSLRKEPGKDFEQVRAVFRKLPKLGWKAVRSL